MGDIKTIGIELKKCATHCAVAFGFFFFQILFHGRIILDYAATGVLPHTQHMFHFCTQLEDIEK